MSLQAWQETLMTSLRDGPILTAAAEALCIPTEAVKTLPYNYFQLGKALRVQARGIISCVITTPGTARFRIYIGADTVFDSGAMPLNIVAKVDVPWKLDVEMICRQMQGGANGVKMLSHGSFLSESVLASPVPTVGGSGSFMLPYNTAPSLSAGFDQLSPNQVSMQFTQTVATGSLTCQNYILESLN